MLIASFAFFLLIFVGVGIWAARGTPHTDDDYLVAGREMPPILTALSVAATTNSGFMFIGFIGLAYLQGLNAIWLALGFLLGDFIMSFFVYDKIQKESVARQATTFPELIAHWGGKNYPYVRIIGAVLTLGLLGLYAAAQLQAGGKALSVVLDWNIGAASLLGGVIILSYCLVGGLRASIWTDAVQSVIMLLTMLLLMIYAIVEVGGIGSFISAADKISPTYLDWFPSEFTYFDGTSGAMLFVLGWIIAGVGSIGQPHIMVRYMAMRSPDEMTQIRLYNYGWSVFFNLFALGVGLAARILLNEPTGGGFDPELSLPALSQQLLPAILAGAMLAGVFAASLSTADSQILSCSAALTHDFSRGDPHPSFRTDELATALVVLFIVFIASFGNYFTIGGFSVFSLVLVAWAGLAVTFGPVLIVYALGARPTQMTIILMMAVSFVAMFLWRQTPLNDTIYSVLPGFIAGFTTYAIDLAFRKGSLAPEGK